MTSASITTIAKYLGAWSRKFHLIAVSLVAAPTVMVASWLVFPVLESHNLGYSAFHLSCILGLGIAITGIGGWIAERMTSERSPSWLGLMVIVGFAAGAIAARYFGDFYWAFDRGYFLD